MSANTSRSDFALALFELLLLLLLELSLLAPGIVSLLSLPLFLPFFCALTAFSLALPFAAAALEELLLASVISASSSQDEPNLSFCCCLAAVRDSGAGASAACKQRHPHFAISAFRRPRQPPWLSSSPHQSWLWLAHRELQAARQTPAMRHRAHDKRAISGIDRFVVLSSLFCLQSARFRFLRLGAVLVWLQRIEVVCFAIIRARFLAPALRIATFGMDNFAVSAPWPCCRSLSPSVFVALLPLQDPALQHAVREQCSKLPDAANLQQQASRRLLLPRRCLPGRATAA